MLLVVYALLPVFLAIVAGHLLRRTIMPDDAHWIGLERLTYYVLFPALIIETLAGADLASVPALGVGAALFFAILAMALLLVLIRPALERRGIGGPTFTSIFQGATRWNTMVALGVATSLYGAAGVTLTSVAMVAMIPVLNVLCVWILARHAALTPPAMIGVVRALAANPLIWSCATGIVLCLAQPPIPQPLHAFATMLGRASVALGLLLVGSGLELRALARPDGATLFTMVLKLALMPAFAVGLGASFGLSGPSLAVVAACAAVPTATNAYVLARQMGGDAPIMAQMLTLQTIVAVATMPLIIWLVA
jgi:malonate transporter and related proteins